MHIAYLVNQYPKVSHSFIRREIRALENIEGMTIKRFSIRETPINSLVDQQDILEHGQTCIILSNLVGLFTAVGRSSVSSPRTFLKATRTALLLGRKNKRGVLRHFAYLAEACLLKELLQKENIEHVHAHFGTNSATVALLCKLLGGPSYSFTVHGPEEFDDPIGLGLKEKIQHCHFVLAISNFGRGQLMRWCDCEQWQKIKVVRCTVDNSYLKAQTVPAPDVPRLVCVGRLCEQKGQLLLVEALNLLDKEGVIFEMVLAGDGEMRNVLEKKINEYKLEKKIHITGWISGDQVKKEILASRAMVLPSFAEGLPVVIMEALALGRPVVSTYVAGIPELVKHNSNGWLTPAGSLDDLVTVLREALVASQDALEQMGEKGAQEVNTKHNAATEAQKLSTYFKGRLSAW